ncbi:MAG: hypothetical protein QXX79_00060 [Candidatus Bathyarchaeia archaeon]
MDEVKVVSYGVGAIDSLIAKSFLERRALEFANLLSCNIRRDKACFS